MVRKRLLFWLLTIVFGFSCFSGCSFKPDPLSLDQISERADNDLEQMFADQEPVSGDVSLYEAMARAIKYNLDYRLQLMEKAMSGKVLNSNKFDLLPQVVAGAGYTNRDDYNGASSFALEGPTRGQESLVTSTSQEKEITTANITVMWNVLDFGIGYFRAKQNADNVMVSEEIRRKVIQNIIQDVRYAYWRAAGIEGLLEDIDSLMRQAQFALDQSRRSSGQNLEPRLETLTYQRELLNNIRILWGLAHVLVPAKTELATLMNLKPGTDFSVLLPDTETAEIPEFNASIDDLNKMALIYRPELREEDYKARISENEINKAYLSLFPILNFQFGYNTDSNSFLYKNDWYTFGAQASLDLINLASGSSRLDVARTRVELDELRRQALAIGVLAQVNISMQRFDLATEEYLITSQLEEVDSELSEQMATEKTAGRVSTLAMIQSKTEAMVSRVRRQIAYAELQNAAGMLYNTLGIDLLPDEVEAIDIDTLAGELEKSFVLWNNKVNANKPGGFPESNYSGL